MSAMANRPVQSIVTAGERGSYIGLGNASMDAKTTMLVVNEYYGDHDEDWVVVYKDGKETERFNCRYLSRIVWLT